MYIWLNLFITLPLCTITAVVWIAHWSRRRAPGPLQMKRPTNLDVLIATYMKRDALDPTSTMTFLIEADALKDPFAERKLQPPPKPSDAATSARPPRSRSYVVHPMDEPYPIAFSCPDCCPDCDAY